MYGIYAYVSNIVKNILYGTIMANDIHCSTDAPIHVSIDGGVMDGNVIVTYEGAENGVGITFTIDANPEAMNIISRRYSTAINPGITVFGNTVTFNNVNRYDAGVYDFISGNIAGTTSSNLTLVVECEYMDS